LDKGKTIKLFVDAHPFDKEFQGTRTFLKGLYGKMLILCPEIEFYFGVANVEGLRKELGEHSNCHYVAYPTTSSLRRIYFDIPAIIRKYGIHIAHFQYISPFWKYCTYIVTSHDILFNDFKSEFSFMFRFSRNFLFKYGIKHADVKTTVSRYSQGRLALHYHLNAEDIKVVPNGVGEEFYSPYKKEEAQAYIEKKYGIKKYILYISRIEPRKNNIMLLKAYLQAQIYKENISLVFIGKTSISYRALTDEIAGMPQEAREHFFHIEQVSNGDLLRFYQGAELFVYPSKAEGFGIPPLEAAALEVPVLCSNRTAMKDYQFFGNHLFDPEDMDELIRKLRSFLNGDFQADAGKIAAEVKRIYNWENSAQVMLDLINKVKVNL
jgi:glycosyltransferase involved in cell wall biosynthesis